MAKTAIVALSSGLDCVTSMAIAIDKGVDVKKAVFFDYGQRAAEKEKEHAALVAKHYGVEFEVVELPWLAKITKTSLVNRDESVPEPDAEMLDAIIPMQDTAAATWVCNRNGVIANILGAYADSEGYGQILFGLSGEESSTFPDNLPEFAEALTHSMTYSTQVQPTVLSYVNCMNKMEIVNKAVELNVPINLMWSCYHGGRYMCKKCESCKRFVRAFTATGNWDLVKNKFNE